MPEEKNVSKKDPNQGEQYQSIQQGKAADQVGSQADLAEIIKSLSGYGGFPVSFRFASLPRIDTGDRLSGRDPQTAVMPSCAVELLALINTQGAFNNDEITRDFREYFKFGSPHVIVGAEAENELDPDISSCDDFVFFSSGDTSTSGFTEWLGGCCICSTCMAIEGNRNKFSGPDPRPVDPKIKRIFIGDLLWVFYYERMGIFQILGRILDAYACNGKLPISNGSIELNNQRDDIAALVLEVMTRQTKTGLSSTVRDRGCSYQTALGWTSDPARKLRIDTNLNTGFNTLFHKFIYHSLEFYKDKRLAVAIQGAAGTGTPLSMATLTTISDTLNVLFKRFESFQYGRTYNNTLSAIIWTIAGMSVIRELKNTLGIPPAFNAPDEFIPAAYDLLVLNRPVTTAGTNRYIVHRECARNGRDILLDIEVIDHQDRSPGGELEQWLEQVEPKIEAYRTAYRTLTGVDLGLSANPSIEQQA
ncbi:MAG: hypothetical protein WBD22_10420 [Pyrinomonadaceae bacterium]